MANLVFSLNVGAEKHGGALAEYVKSSSLFLNQGSTLPCESIALSL